jgi:probable HAF family extracellular repeat protein
MRRKQLFSVLTLLMILAPTASPAIGPYDLTNLGDLPGGDDHSVAQSINSYGQVAGYGQQATAVFRAFLWTPTTPNGTSGSMINLGDLPGGVDQSFGYEVNSYGQVVGASWITSRQRAFLWTPTSPNGDDGSMINLGTLPSNDFSSGAFAINSFGQVVGSSTFRPFLWTPLTPNATTGSMIDLGDVPNGRGSGVASGINSIGQVTGAAAIGFGSHTFLWTPDTPNGTTGSIVDLGDLPGGDDLSQGFSINSHGQVVGRGEAATGDRAFLWSPSTPNGSTGTMIDLGELPGGDDLSIAYSVNSSGHVVGSSKNAIGDRAFLWAPIVPNATTGIMLDLNDLLTPMERINWTLMSAEGINDLGQIVGWGDFDVDGLGPLSPVRRGFLLTPRLIPEPTTMVLYAFAAAVLPSTSLARYRRRLGPRVAIVG